MWLTYPACLFFLFWFFLILNLNIVLILFQWQETGAEYCLCKGFRHDLRWLEQEVGTIRYLTRAVQSSYLSPFHKQYLQSCRKKTPGPWGENIILEFIGSATKSLLKTFVVLYYVLSYFVCFFAHFAHCQLFLISISCSANSDALCSIWYSSNKTTKTWIQISRQNWNGFFSNNVLFIKHLTIAVHSYGQVFYESDVIRNQLMI